MNTRQRVLRTHAASGGAGSLQRRPLEASPRPGPVGGSTAPRAPDRGAAAARRAVEEPGAAPAAAARLEAAMEPAGAAASLPEEEPTHGWQIRHVINLHKVTIAPYCLLIFALGGLNPLGGEPASLTAAIYLALHGAYGLLWCFKDVYFGDANWKKDLDLGTGVALFLSLQLYTAAPILIARNHPATPAWLALPSVAVWGAGVFLHFGADIQKHYGKYMRPLRREGRRTDSKTAVLKTRRKEGGAPRRATSLGQRERGGAFGTGSLGVEIPLSFLPAAARLFSSPELAELLCQPSPSVRASRRATTPDWTSCPAGGGGGVVSPARQWPGATARTSHTR